MKTKEELIEQFSDKDLYPMFTLSCHQEAVYKSMDEYAKQQAIAFMKWYILKMVGLVEYVTKIKPLIRSEELEEKLLEFEGKTFDQLYSQFLEHQSQNKGQ